MKLKSMLLAGSLLVSAVPASAQASSFSVSIPAQSLGDSLFQVSRVTGVQLVFTDSRVRKLRAPRVDGAYTTDELLARLLAGSGYSYRFTNPNTVRIYKAADARAPEARPVRMASAAPVMAASALQTTQTDASGTVPAPPPEAATVETPQEDLVVTGSRIRRGTIDTPTPIVTVTAEDLRESGDTEIGEALAELPAVTSQLNDATVTGNVQNSGLSAVQLRNLGDNRTLVLIDGRRTVSNSGNGNRVSLNTIPDSFIDRVEIITGGASSIYGSDAVAGVINIITETDRRGFNIRARHGITEEGDGREFNLDLSWGTRFADDRGRIFIAGEYEDEERIGTADREFSRRQVDYDYDDGINEFDTFFISSTGIPSSGDQPASTFPPNVPRDLSSDTPGGVFYGASSARDRFFNELGLVPLGPDVQTGRPISIGTSDSGNSGYFLTNRDGYDFRLAADLITPRERYLIAGNLSFDVTDALELFAQAQFSRLETLETRSPEGIASDDVFPLIDPVTGRGSILIPGRIPCRRASGSGSGPCNPFVPDEIRRDVSTNGSGVFFSRRFVEVGNVLTENTRETLRTWAGARGEFSENWAWEVVGGYGEFDQGQFRRNELDIPRLRFALDAEAIPGGGVQCRSAEARAAGCVPINLFGVGSITPEAADYVRVDLRQDLTVTQHTAQAFVTGELFQLPAGPLSVAFGGDYRKDEQELVGDEASVRGGTSANPVPNFGGSISAVEGFVEVSVPILKDQPFADQLSFDASARVADYDIDRVGTVFSYRAGLQWAPVEDLRFRAQLARAQRAPDLAELFSPPRGDFDSGVNDPCDEVTEDSTGVVAENCLAEPGIQMAIDEEGVFEQESTSIFSPNGGNPDLKEETADTITIGAVANPRFLPGLTVAVDYYNIQIEDAINSFGNNDILRQCYDSTVAREDNPFCGFIARNPNNGQLTEVVQLQFNLAGFDVEGIDVGVRYRTDLDGIGLPGRLDLRYDATHLLKQDFIFEGLDGLEVDDQLGELTNRTFKYRARGSIGYSTDNMRLRYTATYFGKIRDSNELREEYLEELANNPNAEVPLFLNIGDVWEHDVYASFDVPVGEDREFTFFGGVNNLFDRVTPFLPTGTSSGRQANLNTAYDIAGRRFYFGVELDF